MYTKVGPIFNLGLVSVYSLNLKPEYKEIGVVKMSLCFSSKESPLAPKEQEITPADLFEMVGKVGERMLVNRARILLMQHETEYNNGMFNEENINFVSYFF